MDELDILKQQHQVFKNSIEHLKLDTGNQLCQQTQKRIKHMNREMTLQIVFGCLAVAFCIAAFSIIAFSWAYCSVICIVLLLENFFIYRSSRMLKPEMLATGSMTEVAHRVAYIKKCFVWHLRIGLLLAMVLLFWGGYEIAEIVNLPLAQRHSLLVSGGIGGIIGIVIGFFINRHQRRLAEKLLDDLRDFEN